MADENEKNEVIEVDAEALKKLMADVEQLKQENKKLTEVADRGRLAHWESTHQGVQPRMYLLSICADRDGEEQVILAWKMKLNQVWKDAEGKWKEKQEIEVTLENEKKQILPYIEFVAKTKKISAKLLSTEQVGNETYLKVEAENGKAYTIDSRFVN